MRVHQQPAYVLLNRPYSESSFIVEVFSRDYGRLALMAKGARRLKSRYKGVLQPFQPTLISWTGKGELPTLTSAEVDLTHYRFNLHELRGDALVCGFYVNELLVNLLHRHDPHAALFDQYRQTISRLANDQHEGHEADLYGRCLREFETRIIKEAGYAVNFEFESDGKTPIHADRVYLFTPGAGFSAASGAPANAISGRIIRAAHGDAADQTPLNASELSQSKHLMRDILNQTLGYKAVTSRELFFPRQR
ncbi:MAG: DNA repair protein RecO [Gammaproteobacteria bacterium]|nr:DNA repair protein RecO [Gammaproteobacteria bacterium]